MKALTVQQPWAWAIVHGGKDVENRTQAWKHRGPIAIHAGQRWSERGGHSRIVADAFVRDRQAIGLRGYLEPEQYEHLLDSFVEVGIDSRLFEYTCGAVVGLVDLVGAHTAHEGCCDSPWGEQAYDEHGGRTRRDIVHLELEHPRALAEPVPCRGALGLWTLPPEVRDAVLEQLVEAFDG